MKKDVKYTLTGLVDFCNQNYKKKNGTPFTSSDIQGYIDRGRLPKFVGDIDIEKVSSNEIIGTVPFYQLKERK